jgi:hypothetical protein
MTQPHPWSRLYVQHAYRFGNARVGGPVAAPCRFGQTQGEHPF